jgi:hypothetical protein
MINLIKNIKKKKLLIYSVGLIIFLIMCYQISFFKKVYFLITRDYDYRLNNTYDYCGHESVGYLIHLKKKSFWLATNERCGGAIFNVLVTH